jgi:hypothetical protein
MLTRKRQRYTEIQYRFNLLTSQQSNQFHPILEAVTKFLKFKDCSNVAKLNTRYHLTTWIYILKSKNREIREPIDVNCKSILWLEKYNTSLKNQHLRLLSIQHDDYNYHKYRHNEDLVSFENEQVAIFLAKQQQIYGFTFGPPRHISVHFQIEILKNYKDLKELTWFSEYINDLPYFPNLESLTLESLCLRYSSSLFSFEWLSRQCPRLKTLIISDHTIKDMTGIGTTIKKMTIDSKNLTSLESLRNVNLEELDVSKCMYISDFSVVAHIPIVKKFTW